ncbi:MAG: lysophospholipase [Gammaproteobacteria bacterium]|nr:lysophospholipase [Gammaproteobacteria bacterium]
MKHKTGSFTGHNSLELFWQSWEPEQDTKATLVLVHGVGEHSGRYENLINHLVDRGFAIYGYDLRGHGRSKGRKGYINSWEDYRQDLHLFVQQFASQTQQLFLMGHSLGGLIALDYVNKYPQDVQGIIASSPPMSLATGSRVLRIIATILNILLPKWQFGVPFNPDGLSRIPTVIQAYLDDPLVHNQITARWVIEGFRTIERLTQSAWGIEAPVLLTHGGADSIVPIEGTRSFYEVLDSEDKEFIFYPDSKHEPHNDSNWKEAVENISNWLEKQLKQN